MNFNIYRPELPENSPFEIGMYGPIPWEEVPLHTNALGYCHFQLGNPKKNTFEVFHTTIPENRTPNDDIQPVYEEYPKQGSPHVLVVAIIDLDRIDIPERANVDLKTTSRNSIMSVRRSQVVDLPRIKKGESIDSVVYDRPVLLDIKFPVPVRRSRKGNGTFRVIFHIPC
jgi:hypothetical protein